MDDQYNGALISGKNGESMQKNIVLSLDVMIYIAIESMNMGNMIA